jgi:hypothetical protein
VDLLSRDARCPRDGRKEGHRWLVALPFGWEVPFPWTGRAPTAPLHDSMPWRQSANRKSAAFATACCAYSGHFGAESLQEHDRESGHVKAPARNVGRCQNDDLEKISTIDQRMLATRQGAGSSFQSGRGAKRLSRCPVAVYCASRPEAAMADIGRCRRAGIAIMVAIAPLLRTERRHVACSSNRRVGKIQSVPRRTRLKV